MELQVVRVLLITSFLLYCYGIDGRIVTSPSELERKPKSKKTIVTSYGDTYDCLNFYEQPAFDHPLLKNHKRDYKITPTPPPNIAQTSSEKAKNLLSLESEGGGCPDGTVPIRRTSKREISRESPNWNPFHNAFARTKGMGTYMGAGAFVSIHNPKVKDGEYSETRIHVSNGNEHISAGWRVDPTLYEDKQTRFFVHTDAGDAHCFNTLCPGFILYSSADVLEKPLQNISKPGGKAYELRLFIYRDDAGNWPILVGTTVIGYWPSRLFKTLNASTSNLEWGAEVFDPKLIPTTEMGSGLPLVHGTLFDAYFRRTSEYDSRGNVVDADDIETYSDSQYYSVSNEGNFDDKYRRTILYGGPNKDGPRTKEEKLNNELVI